MRFRTKKSNRFRAKKFVCYNRVSDRYNRTRLHVCVCVETSADSPSSMLMGMRHFGQDVTAVKRIQRINGTNN